MYHMDPLAFAANVGTAFLLGLLIGLERELRRHEAGLRTNALVALGAALFVSLSLLFDNEGSPTRVAGQVASGIGFLAGGVIIRDGFSVRGLTTAATLWCTAAIGSLAGSGFLIPAAIGTGTVLFLHTALRPVTLRLNARLQASGSGEAAYRWKLSCRPGDELPVRAAVVATMASLPTGFRIVHLAGHTSDAGERIVLAELHGPHANDAAIERAAGGLLADGAVVAVAWERVA
jgi:putative Mg2+ transporter-C (MgtC) family protein